MQIPNISPAQTPSPTLSVNNDPIISTPIIPPPPFRKKNHKPTNSSTSTVAAAIVDEPIVQQRTSDKCDRENVSTSAAAGADVAVDRKSSKSGITTASELEVTVPEPTLPLPPSSTTKKNISMNSLLSPLNQITHQEIQDNNLDRKADGRFGFLILFKNTCIRPVQFHLSIFSRKLLGTDSATKCEKSID